MKDLVKREFNGKIYEFNLQGWFNATVVAKRFGKRVDHFLANEETKEYIKVLSDGLNTRNSGYLKTNRGRNGGTWFHPELAVYFARWLDVRFSIWCDRQIKEIIFGSTSLAEHRRQVSRDDARLDYRPMTDALQKERARQGKETKFYHYINEADLINRIVFGQSSSQFKVSHNIDKNDSIRDYLTELQIKCIVDLQRANTVYISMGIEEPNRKKMLHEMFDRNHHQDLLEESFRITA